MKKFVVKELVILTRYVEARSKEEAIQTTKEMPISIYDEIERSYPEVKQSPRA